MSTTLLPIQNVTTNVTHLLWAGYWIEVVAVRVLDEQGWRFKNGRDACAWLMWPEQP